MRHTHLTIYCTFIITNAIHLSLYGRENSTAGLPNSESSKGQIININFPRVAKVYFSISFRCGDFVVVWKKIWNDNCLFEVEFLQHFLQLRKLSQAARKAFAGRMLCRPRQGYHATVNRIRRRSRETSVTVLPVWLFWGKICKFWPFLTLLAFCCWKKAKLNVAFLASFDQLNFYVRLEDFKDDFADI